MIDHRLLTEQLAVALSTLTGKSIDVMEAPKTQVGGGDLDDLLPYGFVEPLTGSIYELDYGGSRREAEVPFAFYSFGATAQSAEWMASMLHTRYVGQQVYPMTLPGFDVMDRRPDGGPDTPEKVADNLWTIRETFVLHICAK